MNLNSSIETYKQANEFETRLAGITKEIETLRREEENLKKDLHETNLELIRLKEKNQALEKDLQQESGKLEKIMTQIHQAGVTPQTLAELENRYHRLVSAARVVEEKSSEWDTLFQNLSDRLPVPEFQAQFRRLCVMDSQFRQQVTRQKRLITHKKKHEQKKNTLAASLEKNGTAIEKLKETHRKEIDSFLQFREQSPKLAKKKTSLTKKEAVLIGKLQGMEKKLQKEAAPEKCQQLRDELENKKKDLEAQSETRTLLETKKQEITQRLDQES